MTKHTTKQETEAIPARPDPDTIGTPEYTERMYERAAALRRKAKRDMTAIRRRGREAGDITEADEEAYWDAEEMLEEADRTGRDGYEARFYFVRAAEAAARGIPVCDV